ncbi:MAG: sodium:alanine symporter family protein [Lachnospiraceae bacterium]|nr:sodium:alanine symporter family protein [Lachnospiraceae bacterium]
MDMIENIVSAVNEFLWDYALLFLLCGTGIYYTIRLRFVQVRKFGTGVKRLFGSFSLNGQKAGKDGMSSFQALTTAIAAQVGTGNIAGAATALASGGPGAILWMWLSAFFGMATIYAEAVLAQKFKTVNEEGHVTGGPIYYIKAAFRNGALAKFMAGFFSVAIILALGFMGNMVQSNSIGVSFHNAFGVPSIAVGIAIAVIAAFIFLGGVKRIASVTEKLVPIMALLYIIGCGAILVMNASQVGEAFRQIFVMAFNPQAALGGVAGVTVQKAMRFGVARGLFSNEAGMGSTPHAHALAKVEKPEDQGILAMIGVFIDTFIILTLTALVILSTGVLSSGETGPELAQMAFNTAFGNFGNVFIAICMLFFAFSTIVGWYFFGEVNVKALFGPKATRIYAAIVVIFVLVGSALKVGLVWDMSDMFNGLMVIPNLLALLLLSGTVVKITRKKDPIS